MAPSPIDAALQFALDGNLRRLRKTAKEVNLRDAKDDRGRNALHFAAAKGRLGTCEFLVDEIGIGANSLSADGETPVLLAAAEGKVPVLAFLLSCGGDPAKPDSGGATPLHEAAGHGHDEAVRLLLSKGVDVDPLNYKGTPLHLAANKDEERVVKVLLEHGANPNTVVNHVFTPLMTACCGHSLRCMKLLVEAGADVNFKTPRGPTVLLMAVDEGLTDIVKFLVEAGADPNIADNRGRIPIIYAAAYKQREIVETLFPGTKPVSSLTDWSVDGIITGMAKIPLEDKVTYSAKEHIAYLKSQGKQAYAKQDYLRAIYFYTQAIEEAIEEDPRDVTLLAKRSLCWLKMGEGDRALLDAQQCKMMRPRWSIAWYREGMALSLLKNYREAADSFVQALKFDPASDLIKKALREAIDALKSSAGTEGQNPPPESLKSSAGTEGQNPPPEPAATVDISHNKNLQNT